MTVVADGVAGEGWEIPVAVCVATLGRPHTLERLLVSLTQLRLELGSGGALRLALVVVDNDAAGSAGEIVRRFAGAFPQLQYVIEPRRGISWARNRLVSEARALQPRPALLAFVDDDEWVDSRWLSAGVGYLLRRDVDGVTGPVLPVYDEEVAVWVREGGFFERRRLATGTRVKHAATGNLILREEAFARLPTNTPFSTVFARPGGEDTYMTMLLAGYGGVIEWCDEAVVYECVPPHRATAKWLVQRAFYGGYGYSVCLLLTGASRLQLARRAGAAAARIGLGCALLLFSPLVRGRIRVVRALRELAVGLGGLAGLVHAVAGYREGRG
jgi:succinoglycan biosynthesis protein ExoM